MSFKQARVNQAITIISRRTEHANIFLSTFQSLVIFLCSLLFHVQGNSDVSPLQPSDRLVILKNLNYHCPVVANRPVSDVVMHSNKMTGP